MKLLSILQKNFGKIIKNIMEWKGQIFFSYFNGCNLGYAIKIKNFVEYDKYKELNFIGNNIGPLQSYPYIDGMIDA